MELVGVAREYVETADDPSLSGFLQGISLVSDQDTIEEERSLVTLMTLHNAKGLEFRAVFVVGMEEGVFPHSRSIEEQGLEEERRLFYVGVTRAQERLMLTHATARSLWGYARLQPAEPVPRRARSRNRARASPARLVVAVRPPGDPRRAARGGSVAVDRGLGSPWHARRGCRAPDRAGRRGDRALRGRRQRAASDARLRASRAHFVGAGSHRPALGLAAARLRRWTSRSASRRPRTSSATCAPWRPCSAMTSTTMTSSASGASPTSSARWPPTRGRRSWERRPCWPYSSRCPAVGLAPAASRQ